MRREQKNLNNHNFNYDLAQISMKKTDNINILQQNIMHSLVKQSQIQNAKQENDQENECIKNRYQIRQLLVGNNNKKANIKLEENFELQQFWGTQQNEEKKSNVFGEQSFEEQNNSNDSNNDDSFDEEMMLEQVICSDNEEEMRQFIEINELKYNIMNPDYKKLYLNLKKKAILLMQIVKKNISNGKQSQSEEQTKLLQGQLDQYKSLYSTLSQKVTNLNRQKTDIEYQYEQQLQKNIETGHKYEQLKKKLQKIDNETQMLSEQDNGKFDLQEVILLEKKAQDTLQQISKKKNEIIDQLQKKLKNQNDSHKALCSICYIAPIDCLLQPCNHACCCYNCAQILDDCPMDRSLVTNIKRIYLG